MKNNLSRHRNNFDFMRFAAAMMVLCGHSYALTIGGAPQIFGKTIHDMGVVIFFCISGYLISISWANSPSLKVYLWKRALRIFPALAVCVVLTACILGPALTSHSLPRYFSEMQFWRYFENILLYVHYHLPGVFTENKLPAVNGSLWTLPVEFLCYIFLAVAALACNKRQAAIFACIALAAALAYIYYPQGQRIVVLHILLRSMLQVMPFFFIGAVLARLEGKYIHFRPGYAVLLCVALFIVTEYDIRVLNQIMLWACIPYIVLTFGLRALPVVSGWGRYGDFSYGIYLYAFPLQQMVVALSQQQASPMEVTLMAFPPVLLCAVASWHMVEKPALGMKKLLARSPAVQQPARA